MLIPTIFLVALAIATFFNLLGNLKENKLMVFVSKPLLMPFVIGFYVSSASVVDPLIVFAFAFGCAGDVFLIKGSATPKAFMLGLLSFMIGHVFYIISFSISTGFFATAQWWFLLLILPYVLVAVLLLKVLKNDFGKMKGAASVYMGVLLAMSVFALSRLFIASPVSTVVTWLGSVLFVASDAILAIEHFKLKRGILHHTVVMSTYIVGQLLIAAGLLL